MDEILQRLHECLHTHPRTHKHTDIVCANMAAKTRANIQTLTNVPNNQTFTRMRAKMLNLYIIHILEICTHDYQVSVDIRCFLYNALDILSFRESQI